MPQTMHRVGFFVDPHVDDEPGEVPEEDDLRFHRLRHFDSRKGRWISEDPLGFAGSDADLTRYPRSADASDARAE